MGYTQFSLFFSLLTFSQENKGKTTDIFYFKPM